MSMQRMYAILVLPSKGDLNMERFTCGGAMEHRTLSPDTLAALHIKTPKQLHLNSDALVNAAKAEQRQGWVYLPLCNTLCAQGLGAAPTLSLEGARVREQPFHRAEELPRVLSPGFPRMDAMLDAMDRLAAEKYRIAYQVEGPLTLLSTLLPMRQMFAALRQPEGGTLLRRAEDWVCQYAALAAAHGVALFSFADPVATVDILGKRGFTSLYRETCIRLLRRLQTAHPQIPIHLCGKMTQSMLDTGSCQVELWKPSPSCSTYGQALAAWWQAGDYRFIVGHFCINQLEAKRPWLTLIDFEEEKQHGR